MTIKIKGKTLLVIAAGAGMIVTAYLAARNTPEAQKRKEEALEAKRAATGDENAELTFFESTKAQIGAYIPAIISGTVTLGSFVGSEVINKEMLKNAKTAINDFKSMTDELDGKGSSKIIEKAVEQKKLDEKAHKSWDTKEHFRIQFQNQIIEFEATRADVLEAFYGANRYFQGRGLLTFNEFLEFLEQKPVKEGDDRGWEASIGEAIYGYIWIDFGLKPCEDEPWITDIYFAVYPHFFDEDMCNAEIDEGCRKFTYSTKEKETNHLPESSAESAAESADKPKDDQPPW